MTAHRHVVLGRIVGVVLSAVAMMWAAVTLAFLAVHIAPGDPVTAIMGESSDPTQRARIEQDWGLDQPIGVQYVRHLDRLLHGDLGYSYVRGEPVTDILFGEQLGTSAQLAGFALLIAVVLAPLLAVLTAGRRDVFSRALGTAEVVLASAPPFWMGLILIWIFAFTLKVLPVTAGNEFQRLILPAVTLALPIAAVLAQVMREGIERALEQPFALTARSRGISTTRLRLRHGLRHSLIPAATLAAGRSAGCSPGRS